LYYQNTSHKATKPLVGARVQPDRLQELLESVRKGETPVQEALRQIQHLPFENLDFAKIDHHRAIRCGFPEVIFCPGKSTEQIVTIFQKLGAVGNNVLATRAEPQQFRAVQERITQAEYHDVARCITLRQLPPKPSTGTIALVSAGTSDMPVIEEAGVTCEIMDQPTQRFYDVGVAGIHRLLAQSEALRKARVVIVAAGMEGALASVVGGLVEAPVIAVPTSIGYGASFHGLAPLLTMLNSCATGVAVVNIDNGFAAGYLASIINRLGEPRQA
jgi:pyridinium-3,5-biscarboxylic acid mononucleotide synthase